MKLENKSVKQLKAQLDKVFSIWIRERDNHTCVTCGKKMKSNESQCGHYISRGKNNTRFSEINCNCQCSGCNIFKGGNMPAYTIFLERKYGYGIIQKLKKEGDTIKQFKEKELIELIKKYDKKN